MLTTTHINKYPYFDLTDIIVDFDLRRHNFKPVSPVRTGNILPELTLSKDHSRWQQFFNGAETHGPVQLRQLLSKPLVLFFYSIHWKAHGTHLLKTLNALQYEIKANGGNLLVITAEREEQLEKIVWDNSLSLSFYHDKNNEIASKFRIFSDDDPVWNKFSGIDANVPLLATYVLSENGQVVFDHVDNDLDDTYPSRNVITAVNQASISHKHNTSLSA